MVIEYARPLGPEFGAVAQLVRVPDCRSGGCGFESRPPRFRTPLHAGFSLRTIGDTDGGLRALPTCVVRVGVCEPSCAEMTASAP